jgi:hypothetical protein
MAAADSRPRLLLISEFSELEWAIKPSLEEWAQVISFDPPGIGDEPLPSDIANLRGLSREVVITRAIEKLGEAGWERFFLVADGWGISPAVSIATQRPEALVGMALGHAALSHAREGDRAPIRPGVYDAFTELVKQDARSFVRHGIAQVTRGGIDEDLAAQIIARIPPEFGIELWTAFTADDAFGERLAQLDCPLLLAKHQGCLLSTDEGFEDAVAALPRAETVICKDPPAASPAFAQTLRRFCTGHWTAGDTA